MTRAVCIVFFWGCAGNEGSSVGSSDTPVTASDTVTLGSTLSSTSPDPSAWCEPTANTQVFQCSVRLEKPGPAGVTFTAAESDRRIFESPGTQDFHVFYAWGLLPETTYEWDAGVGSGQLTTGALPPSLADLDVDVQGQLFGMDAVLVYVSCGWFVMLDSNGRVIWHQESGLYDYITDGMRWSQEERMMLTLQDTPFSEESQSAVLKRDLAGRDVLYLSGEDLALRTTHDLDVWNGYLYVLGREPGAFPFTEGGVEVFDGSKRIGQWMISDAFPEEPSIELDHLNTLSVGEDGEITLSVYNRSAVLGLDGDPASPQFLGMRYHALGDPEQLNAFDDPDYAPVSEVLFKGPHNPNREGDSLWVFDNESGWTSRAVELAMNGDGTLTERAVYSAGDTCPNQGGAIPVEGGVLVTCPMNHSVYLYREGAAEPDWTLTASCGERTVQQVSTRGYPVKVE